ncbi:YvcK family protein [Alkalibacter sp. M17DMB]|nr:YvcK family protein [Alkalibacter mobilis]
MKSDMRDIVKKHSKRVVVIGGGTGSSVILRGFKKYTENITAIVTVADDGGGSGVLREDLGMLPPGDIRSCILALADEEGIMQKLLNYRFEEGMLKGQSFGNLFIAAMNGISGNFMEAIRSVSDVMAIKGRVLPVSLDKIILRAKLTDGEMVDGESHIPQRAIEKNTKIQKVSIHPSNVKPLDEAIEAIINAQAVIIGPGSLYTSVIPNLLVDGIEDALRRTEAEIFYISNIMTQPGETDDYDVWDHVRAIETHLRKPDETIFDYIVVNRDIEPGESLDTYRMGGSQRVRFTESEFMNHRYKLILGDFAQVKSNYIRHDADKLAEAILEKV